MPQTPGVSIEQFNKEVDHIFIPSLFLMVKLSERWPQSPLRYYPISLTDFISESLINFVLTDLTTIINGPLAIKCLENLGLENVTLWRGTSYINNRNNVHLLRGFKVINS